MNIPLKRGTLKWDLFGTRNGVFLVPHALNVWLRGTILGTIPEVVSRPLLVHYSVGTNTVRRTIKGMSNTLWITTCPHLVQKWSRSGPKQGLKVGVLSKLLKYRNYAYPDYSTSKVF